VNYATLGARVMAFNYRSIYMPEDERLALHQKFIVGHYLKQFNEETIRTKQQHTCGEPCPAVCKKTRGEYKKDYEPYQTMGPQCGIFDQRAAERLNHHANTLGFDAISVGGVLSWLMECLDQGQLSPGRWWLEHLKVQFARGGATVSSRVLPKVRGHFYVRPDATDDERAMTQRLPELIRDALQQLQQPIPSQPHQNETKP
jgi:hypothetical protein